MAVVLVTGMSGTGKSSALDELARRGRRVVDTDYGGWIEHVPSAHGSGSEPLWREGRIGALLDAHDDGTLFLCGCVANQGAFYPRFDAVVLLSAPVDVILERVATRDTNDFGKSDDERARILADLAEVEPRLRAGATAEIDTCVPLEQVVDAPSASRSRPRVAGRRPRGRAWRRGAERRHARAGIWRPQPLP